MELLELMENWGGFVSLRDMPRPANYEQRIKETIDLLTNARGLPSHRHQYALSEAMTTSDFPYLFGDVLQRQVLASYRGVPPVWKAFVRMGTVPRIFPQIGGYRFAITGGDQYLPQIGEKAEYPASSRDEKRYPVYVFKYGRQFDISWETLINDDLGALRDTPERFGRAAVRTEHRAVTGTYAGDVGSHTGAALYEYGINCTDADLTIPTLEAAVSEVQAFMDDNGEPIANRPKFLVVPPALEFTARQILTSTTKMWLGQGGGDGSVIGPYPMTNVISQYGLQLLVDPYLPVLDKVSGVSAWYLFADPGEIAALEFDHLVGHESPEICMKASDKVSIGGGEISPLAGDFATDNVLYRVRTTFGGVKLDWRATYMGGYKGGS